MHPVDQQTILVTGATGGLGRTLVLRLCGLGATVVAHGRDRGKLDDLAEEVRRSGGRIDPVLADLSDLAEVDRLADTVLDRHAELHALVNNAGVGFGPSGGEREVSRDGIELRFAVNHLAGLALAQRLSDRLRASAPARIVQVASAGQQPMDPDDPLTENNYDGVTAYRRSKLAQVMAGYDLAADLVGTDVTVNSVHPATFMDTAMVREHGISPVSTVEEGVEAVLRLVVDPDLDGVSGRYFNGTEEAEPDPQADDPGARGWVRALSEGLLAAARATPAADRT